jgi:hypothetical protein
MSSTPPITVSTVPPAQPPSTSAPAASPQAGGGTAAADAAVLQQELETLKGKLADTERNAQFWYEKASTKEKAPVTTAERAAEDDTDVLDVITTKGSKGLDELVAKRGYVRKDEVQAMVNEKAIQLTKEAQLLKEYPDLSDPNSEFFQATAKVFGELKNAGVSETMAMELAAERVDLQFLRTGKRKTPAQQRDEDKAAREEERKARLRAQSGERGNHAPVDNEEDEELTAEQKHIVQSMGITEEAYKKRAKEGVKMRGGMR